MKKITIAGLSDVGKVREKNEDHFLVQSMVENRALLQTHITTDALQFQLYGVLCAIADGMGGHAGGERASMMALDMLWKQYFSTDKTSLKPDQISDALQRIVQSADKAIRQTATSDPSLHDMGTTLVGLLLRPEGAYAFHAGDSRLYRLQDGYLKQITMDHSIAYELEKAGKLSREEGETFEQKHIISNSLGGQGKECQLEIKPILSVKPGDRFLLCSDGLSDMVKLENLEMICRVPAEPAAVTRALVREANNNGGEDNVTAIVVDVG